MSRNLVVTVSALSDAQRGQILDAARKSGFSVSFFKNEEEALPAFRDAEVVFGHSVLAARTAPDLLWLCTPFAGVDQIREAGFLSPDAVLTNSSGAYGVTIAEHTVMVTLEMLRRQPEYDEIVRQRRWQRDLPVRSILGSRVTFLGTGDIGRETAVRFRAFAPGAVTGVSRGGKNPGGLFDETFPREQLDDVLPRTDILVISLPGTKETFHMLDARRLSLLPDGALVVNVGRGSVVDQSALARELRAGRLSAALDVFEEEPIPPEDPMWDCPNLLITTHVAGNMTLPYTRRRIVELFLEDFDNYCHGRPLLRQVDPEKGY